MVFLPSIRSHCPGERTPVQHILPYGDIVPPIKFKKNQYTLKNDPGSGIASAISNNQGVAHIATKLISGDHFPPRAAFNNV